MEVKLIEQRWPIAFGHWWERAWWLMVTSNPQRCLPRYLKREERQSAQLKAVPPGYIAKLLTDQPGSSAWFWGGVASYANEAKKRTAWS